MKHRHGVLAALSVLLPVVSAMSCRAETHLDQAASAMQAYLDFADYGGGVVTPAQIVEGDWKQFLVVDARSRERFETGHIPGALHIEWRELVARRNELPRDRLLLLYCDSGMLSAQAHFALRVLGWENSRLLQGGLNAWKQAGGATEQQAEHD